MTSNWFQHTKNLVISFIRCPNRQVRGQRTNLWLEIAFFLLRLQTFSLSGGIGIDTIESLLCLNNHSWWAMT
jgi:hypothetical protein